MNTIKVLQRAKKLIDLPGNWVKNSMATDARGVPTDSLSENASRFCALGAITRAAKQYYPIDAEIALVKALPDLHRSILTFNDDWRTSHSDIMSLFDRAISILEEKH